MQEWEAPPRIECNRADPMRVLGSPLVNGAGPGDIGTLLCRAVKAKGAKTCVGVHPQRRLAAYASACTTTAAVGSGVPGRENLAHVLRPDWR